MTFDNSPLTGPYIHNIFFCYLICIAIGYGGGLEITRKTHISFPFWLRSIRLNFLGDIYPSRLSSFFSF